MSNAVITMRFALILLLFALLASGATFKLYLTDGSYQLVSEYKILDDRIRYYSTERGEWEEIPKELVDLKRTQAEVAVREQNQAEERKLIEDEEKAERAERQKIANIPAEPGAYHEKGAAGAMTALKAAETKLVINKKRQILKVLAPVPLINGKGTVEIEGVASGFAVDSKRPEFYLRLSKEQAFGIFRLNPSKGGTRIVEDVMIVPVVNQRVEEPEEIEIFRQQVADGLYKIWPMQDLEAGEYAVVEYTPLEVNPLVWDFAVPAAVGLPPTPLAERRAKAKAQRKAEEAEDKAIDKQIEQKKAGGPAAPQKKK
jgi:hypothetical protein